VDLPLLLVLIHRVVGDVADPLADDLFGSAASGVGRQRDEHRDRTDVR
jgi:hypothetical protein